MTLPFKSFAIAISLAAAISALSRPAASASFSCMALEDLSRAEQAVCTHDRLGALDERLDSWYRRALVRAGYFDQTDTVTQQQRAWLGERDACGADVGCLRRLYRTRIEALRRYVEHV